MSMHCAPTCPQIEGCNNCTASVDSCEPQGCDTGYFDSEKKACVAVRQQGGVE